MAQVSVIIPCFNAEDWIRDTLRSALEQDCDREIIAVDDGSTDGTVEILKGEFPSVRLITSRSRNPGKARNLGTAESKGEFIQYLDADDLLAPGKINSQLAVLKNSGADIAYGDWQKLIRNRKGDFERGEKITRRFNNSDIALFTCDFWCPPAAYLFRRSMVERVGGWNETLPFIQDVRFALDCALHGGRFEYCPGIMCYYRVNTSNSVSTRDPTGFIRDCLLNDRQIEEWWRSHGGINAKRKEALLNAYGYVARTSFGMDRESFETSCSAIERLSPSYIPQGSKRFRLASRLVGYRSAESLAFRYKKMRGFLKSS